MTATVADAPAPPLLRNPDFVRLWKGETISKTGTALTSVALPLVAAEILGANTFMMGVLAASIWLPWLLVGLPAGVWADRLRSRPLMITCDLVAAALIITVPLAIWLDILTMTHVLIVSVVAGCAGVFFTAAYNAYVPFLVGKKQIFQANSRLHATESAAQMSGPAAGILIAQLAGSALGIFLDALTFLVSALYLRRIGVREPSKKKDGPKRNIGQELRESTRFLMGDPYMRVLTVNIMAVNLCFGGVQGLTLVFLVREIGLGGWSYGTCIIAIAFGGILGSILAPVASRLLGPARALLILSPLSAVFALLFVVADQGWGFVIALGGIMLWSLGAVINNVISTSFRQSYCPPEMLGRIAATIRTFQFGMLPVGSILGGLLGTVLDIRTAIWIFLVTNIFVRVILFVGPLKYSRDLPERGSLRPA
jgi:hypothetical protein